HSSTSDFFHDRVTGFCLGKSGLHATLSRNPLRFGWPFGVTIPRYTAQASALSQRSPRISAARVASNGPFPGASVIGTRVACALSRSLKGGGSGTLTAV